MRASVILQAGTPREAAAEIQPPLTEAQLNEIVGQIAVGRRDEPDVHVKTIVDELNAKTDVVISKPIANFAHDSYLVRGDCSSAAPIATVAVSAPVVVSAEPVPSASAVAAASASAAPAASQIPTQEDFEKKAKATVSSKTSAAQELTKIEKEIGQ